MPKGANNTLCLTPVPADPNVSMSAAFPAGPDPDRVRMRTIHIATANQIPTAATPSPISGSPNIFRSGRDRHNLDLYRRRRLLNHGRHGGLRRNLDGLGRGSGRSRLFDSVGLRRGLSGLNLRRLARVRLTGRRRLVNLSRRGINNPGRRGCVDHAPLRAAGEKQCESGALESQNRKFHTR